MRQDAATHHDEYMMIECGLVGSDTVVCSLTSYECGLMGSDTVVCSLTSYSLCERSSVMNALSSWNCRGNRVVIRW